MSLIQPFLTRIDFRDARKRQVRLIHQSVRELIIAELTWNWPRLQGLAISTAADQVKIRQSIEDLDACIFNICVRYLLLDKISNTDLLSEEQVAIKELPQEFELFNDDGEPAE